MSVNRLLLCKAYVSLKDISWDVSEDKDSSVKGAIYRVVFRCKITNVSYVKILTKSQIDLNEHHQMLKDFVVEAEDRIVTWRNIQREKVSKEDKEAYAATYAAIPNYGIF